MEDRFSPFRIAAYYVIFGAAWILLSDSILHELIQDADQESRLQTAKGWFFIIVTGGLVYYLTSQLAKSLKEKNAESKHAEKALRESEKRFRTLIEHAPEAITIIDVDTGLYVDANPMAEALHGLPRDELINKIGPANLSMEFQPDGRLSSEVAKGYLNRALAGQFPRFEWIHLAMNGKETLCEVNLARLPDPHHNLVRAIIFDITEQKQLEAQIRRSQKLDSIGQLTGGIAHDFNNIIGIIMGNLEILQLMFSSDEKALNRIEKALKGANRGADITRKLLNFSRTDMQEKSLISINELINNQKDLIAKSLTASIKVNTHLSKDLWTVAIDPGDLEDAILNLSLNARDALPEGGTLIIETVNKVLDENYVQNNPGSEAGEFVMIAISDNGTGMTEEIREKVFEPFFTTKEPGKGTGLGLSMVYGFVQRTGGSININSEVGKGTTIRLYLPRAREGGDAGHAENDISTDLPRGSETILIVDDEDELLEIAVSFMKYLGYKILSATNAEQAIQILKDNKDIDLMLSDVIMPGQLNGYQLAQAAHDDNPALKILLASGFTKEHGEFANSNGVYLARLMANLLNKPYNLLDLALAVRRTLDEES